MSSEDEDDYDDETYGYPGGNRSSRSYAQNENEEATTYDDDVPAARQTMRERPLPRRKMPDDADVDEEDDEASTPMVKNKPAVSRREEEEEPTREDEKSPYLFWCKNARRVYEVPDSVVVRESTKCVNVQSRDFMGTLMHSNAENAWKHLSWNGDQVSVMATRAGSQQSTERCFTWVLRISVSGDSKEENRKNSRFLVPIPFNNTVRAAENWANSSEFRESGLVTRYTPKRRKQVSPSALKWRHVSTPFESLTTAHINKREAKRPRNGGGDDEEDDDEMGASRDVDDEECDDLTSQQKNQRKDTGKEPICYTMSTKEGHNKLFNKKPTPKEVSEQSTVVTTAAPAAVLNEETHVSLNGGTIKEINTARRMTHIMEFRLNSPHSGTHDVALKPPHWAKQMTVQVSYFPATN